MERVFGKPLITEQDIARKVKELGQRITEDYEGKELIMICLLKGAYVFFADLVRHVRLPLRVDFMIVSSYAGTVSTGKIQIISDLSIPVEGKDVLIVEDIIDSGLTLHYVRDKLLERNPASLRICVLLDKKERRKYEVPLDYVGFTIPNQYIIGYGLDYKDRYRNLPYIAILDETLMWQVERKTST